MSDNLLDPQQWETSARNSADGTVVELDLPRADDQGVFHIPQANGQHNGEPTKGAVALYDSGMSADANIGISDRIVPDAGRRNADVDVTRSVRPGRVVLGGGVVNPTQSWPEAATVGMGSLNLRKLEEQLTLPANLDTHSYGELKKCINTVESALKATNWQRALDKATRLCFTVLVIAFIMARHADPTFPALADWGVIARMRSPFLNGRECLVEHQDRAAGEPLWQAKCFEDDQLFLGTGQDANTLFIKNADNTWTKLDLLVTPEVRAALEGRFDTERQSASINNQIWRQLAE